MTIFEDTLIYDIETRTFGKPDADKDEMRLFGCYSYKKKKFFLITNKETIQKAINSHKYLVGFNNIEYDNKILQREGIDLKYKYIIDLMIIIKKRKSQMKIKEGMLGDLLMDNSLKTITKILGIVDKESGKKEIDYNIFKKKVWTTEEMKMINDYTKRDIEVTKKLYEWIENYFSVFKHYITDKDIKNKQYLTCSIAAFAYKAICKEMNWEEKYNDEVREERFSGGYVAYPAGEQFQDNIYMFDFSSLYPNCFIQANLFGDKCDCCEIHEKWHGDNFFKVKGYYCKKKLSPLSELFKKMFIDRKRLKEQKDPREYSLKIILNGSYGATSNPTFTNIYNLTAAKDCTALGRQMIHYVRKRFRENEYINLMSDTDSIVVKAPENKTKEDAIKLSKLIVDELQQHLPFPW